MYTCSHFPSLSIRAALYRSLCSLVMQAGDSRQGDLQPAETIQGTDSGRGWSSDQRLLHTPSELQTSTLFPLLFPPLFPPLFPLLFPLVSIFHKSSSEPAGPSSSVTPCITRIKGLLRPEHKFYFIVCLKCVRCV